MALRRLQVNRSAKVAHFGVQANGLIATMVCSSHNDGRIGRGQAQLYKHISANNPGVKAS